jgi:hypothetical protein
MLIDRRPWIKIPFQRLLPDPGVALLYLGVTRLLGISILLTMDAIPSMAWRFQVAMNSP